MDTELVPEFIYDQGLYYPATGNYYGYVCTGIEPAAEWDDQHKFLGVDGQDVQFSGLQTENLPCVYYTPSYDYSQSPYNPYNPYIPGAVVGTDGPYAGTQPCFTTSTYVQTVPPPGYVPFINQPGSETFLNGSPDPLLFGNSAVKYAPPLSSMAVTTTSLKVSLDNLSLEPSHSSSQPIQVAGRLADGPVVSAASRKKFLPYADRATAGMPQMTPGTGHLSHVGVPSIHTPLKVALPDPRSNVPGWFPNERTRPRITCSGIPNRILSEQNMGPRANKLKTPLESAFLLKAYTTKAGNDNLDGNIIVHSDQYNRDDFPLDYPVGSKFFVIKSYSEDDVHKSIKYNVWSSTSSGNKKLEIAYEEAQRMSAGKPRKCPVFLFFSVNASGHFCGVAEMIGPVDFNRDMDFWLQDKWTGSFPVKWHIIKDVPNASFRHIILENNEYRPVTSSRDTQEIPYYPGMNMLMIFKNCPLKASILDDFQFYEGRQRAMQEEKSLLLGRKSSETSVPLPVSAPSKHGEAVNQHPQADGPQVSSANVQAPNASGTSASIRTDHHLETDSRKMVCDTAGDSKTTNEQKHVEPSHSHADRGQANGAGHQPVKPVGHDKKADDKQKDVEPIREVRQEVQANFVGNQPSKTDAKRSSNASVALESDGRKTNQRVKQPSETRIIQTKNSSTTKSTNGSAQNDVRDNSTSTKVVLQGGKKGKPESVESSANCSAGHKAPSTSTSSKVDDEKDVLTVGSMQIEITDANKLISGTLTIGSIPVNVKGLKT